MKSLLALAITVGLAAASAGVSAEPPRYVGENEVPRPIDVAKALGGAKFQPQMKKRGISFDPAGDAPAPVGLVDGPSGTASAPEAAAPRAVAAATPKAAPKAAPATAVVEEEPAQEGGSMDVAVAFALNSADLQPKALAQLDSIAEGLKLLDGGTVVVIDGHTDSTGPEPYNAALSLRRAQTVKQYLVNQHGIPAERLRARGQGESHPLDQSNPEDARNRRVQFSTG
ncbi:OmpA family protein [Tahibacter amnicola]|uniref:OmpA family protein n=1 Tax=Tahibacter amnicola TaxID=2976241 RepID=A0ABY6BEN2_9GAMM|nr:OmpA family protein [Tahibacter amnicola]UXI68496.1 OmpA family protein [Tahibacter amnicola]